MVDNIGEILVDKGVDILCLFGVYYLHMKKRTNVYLDDDDHAAIARIQKHHKLASEAAAIRFVVHKEDKAIQREELKESKQSSSSKAKEEKEKRQAK